MHPNRHLLRMNYLPPFKYSVETRHFNELTGKISEWIKGVRYYEKKQDVNNYPDNKMRRNFKKF